MLYSFAHIINPVNVRSTSDLKLAQPITFTSLAKAKSYSNELTINQYAICYPEDHEVVPSHFTLLPYLERSVLDINNFNQKLKLPIFYDIINSLKVHSSAEFLIYSNVDIAVQPHFYSSINWIINQGYDAFVVNRRTIDNSFSSIDDLNYLYSQTGEKHFGHDCFIFKRELFDKFIFSNVCIGVKWVGRVLIWNLIANARNFKEFTDLHMTFHLGDERRWKHPELNDYVKHNWDETVKVFDILKLKTDFIKLLEKQYPHLLIER